jgi:branched-chain amino acid transport system permease protein
MPARLKDALLTAFVTFILALPLAGARTVDGIDGLAVEWHVKDVAAAAALIFIGRLLLSLIDDGHAATVAAVAFVAAVASAYVPMPSHFLQAITVLGGFAITLKGIAAVVRHSRASDFFKRRADARRSIPAFAGMTTVSTVLILFLLILPFTPLANRYSMDVAIMVLTYVMLALGLNITVGYAGLLDLGYVGFYGLGAYSYALLSQAAGIGFWTALPIAGLLTAATGFVLGFPVLRLRGDYFAIVTLGFGEIVRLVLTNWMSLTNGPNGIIDIPRPTLFGLEFANVSSDGGTTFHDFFGVPFDALQRVTFLYYIILALALLVGIVCTRLRRLPLGRAWEAFREDEIACAALGVNRTRIKLAAYSLGATVAGLAGAFFAARQGFVSPESFTFTETATILAIVILGGVGHPLGIVLAAAFIIGLPELFRDLEQYRMLAFGAGLVLIMIWRPGGMMSVREPTVRLLRTLGSES